MKKIYLVLWASLGLLAFQTLNDGPLRTIANQLFNYLQTYPSEKVYLHTDREVYAAGDNLWLKAYLVDGILHQADSISGTLYVQLTNEEGAILETRVLRAEDGYAIGDFALNDSLPDGPYQLVAFTNWMLNSSPSYFFRKTINILNSREEPKVTAAPKPALDVQFFPEGGNLVTGVRSRVAFKAINGSGLGVKVEGSVATTDGQEVALIQSEHAGMGAFLLKPEKGKQYVATIRSDDGLTQRFTLPAALDSGVVLTVDNSITSSIKVSVTESNPGSQALYLVGHVRGQVRFLADLPKGRSPYFYINRKLFPDEGVIHFTVFNQQMTPLSERLIFSTNRKPLTVEIQPDKATYQPYEKINLAITVKDADNQPVAAELSLAATDAGLVPATPGGRLHGGQNIYSYLLLSSDLRGYIENPDYYFNPENEKAASHLDLLMMTQGWRRFVWSEVLRDVYAPPTHAIQSALPVSGRILLPPGNKPAEDLNFSLFAQTNDQQQVLSGITETGGKFTIPDGAVYNSTTQFQVKSRLKQNLNVLLDPLTVPTPTQVPISFRFQAANRTEYSSFLKNAENWQEVSQLIRQEEQNRATAKATGPDDEEGDRKGRKSKSTANKKPRQGIDPRRNTYGMADTSFPLTDNIRNGFSDILQVLKGRVPGVTVSGDQVLIRGISTIMGSTEPLFLIDGIPSSKGTVLSLSVRDVEAIDVLKGPSASAFGTRGSNGVINVLTRRYEKEAPDTGSSARNTIGYAIAREFYAPRYDAVKPGQFPDRRPTLHWVPSIKTGADGKATVSYWNSGSPTTVEVVIQGAIPTGKFGTGTASYQIR
ncbi:TonB-dependent receptor plug domain-containing protein [Telluribacter humicola]|uniref:TonB-dependent receptor plug domain-containing protein n=1 Tax=Telluribacter humicola TaxID=1720261 RepID=UPI001A96338A|nr:TonB-dependent receptor plug domain-containing protein [Telluribacter humicola]